MVDVFSSFELNLCTMSMPPGHGVGSWSLAERIWIAFNRLLLSMFSKLREFQCSFFWSTAQTHLKRFWAPKFLDLSWKLSFQARRISCLVRLILFLELWPSPKFFGTKIPSIPTVFYFFAKSVLQLLRYAFRAAHGLASRCCFIRSWAPISFLLMVIMCLCTDRC